MNSLNNTLQVNGVNKYIPNGNYCVKTFKTILLTLLPPGTTVTYNDTQNTYTFTGTGKMKPITMGNLIGLTNDIQVNINNLTTGLINLSVYSKVILRTQGITYYQSNLENLTNTSVLQLYIDVIFWKTKTIIEQFKMISYNNEDTGNNFSFQLQDKIIFRLQIQ
jgi:hypothetical protein